LVQRLIAYGEPVDGTLFGRYRLIEMIGRGGMGEVWRAHDTAANNRTVAIKVLPAHLAGDSAFVARFRREADAAAQLNNPHIIPIHNYGEIDGRLYVDMRFVEGRDLAEVLADGPLEPGRAVRIVEQVAKALQAAHHIGLVHRDVKPSNILLDADDFAYLIDFGIARAADQTRMTGTNSIIGSWPYMSPERLRAGQVDARADIYALACVLYECLTGSTPYPGDNFEQQITAHLTEPPPRPSSTDPNLPVALDPVIATGMAKDPDQRYATTVELANAARDAITVPIQRPTPTPARPPTEPAHTPASVWQQPANLTLDATQHHPPSWPPVSPPRPGAWPGQQPPPQWAESPLPRQPASRGGRSQWLALGVAALVVVAVLGVAGIYFGTKQSNNTAAISTITSTPIPTTTTPIPTTTTLTPTGTTTTTATSAAAGVPGLTPFVGIWGAHEQTLVIRQNGSGHLSYADLGACPSCAAANAPTATVDFTLISVSNNTATGNVDASSDEQNIAVGVPVTAQLVAGTPSGQILKMSMGRMQEWPFCNNTSIGQCGA
jgi:serine/threonine-protein kinase